MTIAVGSDHAGFAYKEMIAKHLGATGYEVLDVGTNSTDRVDYPDYGKAVGEAVIAGKATYGMAVCGSGIGICIAANKVAGIRAATVHDMTSARLSREHNDANVMCVGERFLGPQVVLDCVEAFLAAEFQGGRHAARVAKLG
ncbi:MAG: ribose 5-phosphate isomerase B [Acidimicrobiales bacterium]|nr:ribose 5-phosphate isomerase B [Acidimicrobiales bacterium]